MASTSRRAVLTGVGVVCAIGKDTGAFWQSLAAGRGGIKPLRVTDPSGLPVRFAGEMPEFDAKEYVEKKDRRGLKVMARTIQMAVAAAHVALNDGRVAKDKLEPERFGAEFGAGMMATELLDLGEASRVSANGQRNVVDLQRWGEHGLEVIEPLWMLKYLPNMLACHVSILHNAQGPNNTITENDVAGLLALGEAYRIIGRDAADIMMVGGAESRLNTLGMVRQCLFGQLSHHNAEPEKACRPFDRRRDGIVLGEGGSVLLLEDLEHARKRGAPIYAEVVGYGAAFDRRRDGAGLARAIRAALAEAQITPDQVDHINAHGWSTQTEDRWEARGLHEVFGECRPAVPVFAAKSYFGSLGAGGSTTELAASLLALKHGTLPPTLNYEQPDPECPVHVCAGASRPIARPHALKVSFTERGQCAAVVVRKWDS